MAEHTAGNPAHDQASRPVVAATVVLVVVAAIDAVAPVELACAVSARVRPVVTRRVVAILSRLEAVVVVIAPLGPAAPIVIPTIMVPVAAMTIALGISRRWLQPDRSGDQYC